MDNLRLAVEKETGKRKQIIAGSSICNFIFATTVGSVAIAWFANQNKIQDAFEDLCTGSNLSNFVDCSDEAYDYLFVMGPYTNEEKAAEYALELADNCGATCEKIHIRWSQAYVLSGIVMLLSAFNALIQVLGTWNHTARAASACCSSLLSCTNLATIVLVAIYRWNTVGKLAALSETPTKYDGQPFTIN